MTLLNRTLEITSTVPFKGTFTNSRIRNYRYNSLKILEPALVRNVLSLAELVVLAQGFGARYLGQNNLDIGLG